MLGSAGHLDAGTLRFGRRRSSGDTVRASRLDCANLHGNGRRESVACTTQPHTIPVRDAETVGHRQANASTVTDLHGKHRAAARHVHGR